MSGWSGIYFRYDVENREYGKPERGKGLVGNNYKGFEPYHIFVRAMDSVPEALGCLSGIGFDDVDESIGRTIDVDFIDRHVEIGWPATEYGETGYEGYEQSGALGEEACDDNREAVTRLLQADLGVEDSILLPETEGEGRQEQAQEPGPGALGVDASSYFFCDCNYYGGFVFDVRGYVNERVRDEAEQCYIRKHALEARYAFLDDTYFPNEIMTPRQYVQRFADHFDEEEIGEEGVEAVRRLLDGFEKSNDHPESFSIRPMARDELAEYLSDESVREYRNKATRWMPLP